LARGWSSPLATRESDVLSLRLPAQFRRRHSGRVLLLRAFHSLRAVAVAMTFDVAIERVLSHEGGFSDDPRDRGNWTGGKVGSGELKGTKWGISAASYPHLDIANLTREDAIELYRRDYWRRIHPESLPPGFVYQVFDMAVNHGVVAAIRALQQSVGVKVDGLFGPKTLAAVQQMRGSDLVALFVAERLEAFTDAPTWKTHGRGWVRRVATNLKFAVEDDKRDG
jgi:lysozyme family protein